MSKESQNKIILKHMQSGGTITSLEAVTKFRCTRLASRINDLKNMGYSITKTWERGIDSRYIRYSMEA